MGVSGHKLSVGAAKAIFCHTGVSQGQDPSSHPCWGMWSSTIQCSPWWGAGLATHALPHPLPRPVTTLPSHPSKRDISFLTEQKGKHPPVHMGQDPATQPGREQLPLLSPKHDDNMTTLPKKLRFVPSSPPHQEKRAFHAGKGLKQPEGRSVL